MDNGIIYFKNDGYTWPYKYKIDLNRVRNYADKEVSGITGVVCSQFEESDKEACFSSSAGTLGRYSSGIPMTFSGEANLSDRVSKAMKVLIQYNLGSKSEKF